MKGATVDFTHLLSLPLSIVGIMNYAATDKTEKELG